MLGGIRFSHIIAIGLAAGIAGWMYTGQVIIGGQSDSDEATPTIVERETERSGAIVKVKYVTVAPQQRTATVLVRGRTQANATVPVRSQVSGILKERLVSKGQTVQKGDVVCVVDEGPRAAQLAQAQAQMAKAQIDFDANSKLAKKGFAAQTKLASMKAALDSAKAGLRNAELQLEYTRIKANASGTVQDPVAQAGDMLSIGASCVTLIQSDPMKFVGQVSERDIHKFGIDATADVSFVGGENVKGRVTYIAPSADASTRTFLTEITIPNPTGAIRDGLTAQAIIKLEPISAYRLSPSWLTLADDGTLGVRTVDSDSIVGFSPLTIIAQGADGLWVNGLKPGTQVISFGQEYVVAGEKVDAVEQEFETSQNLAGTLNQ